MCMFSRHVELVASTKIFARGLPDGRQVLIYAMDVAAPEPVAMVLPLPVPANGPDDAIELVNLESYPNLFDDLKRAFPREAAFVAQAVGRQPRGGHVQAKLVVHQVGAFVASYVPTIRDFDRLDPRFRLSSTVLAALPQYADWGFAVFQLDARTRTSIHPMALRYPRRDPSVLTFPTVHVHDGAVPADAAFDHALYAQLDPVTARVSGWAHSTGALGSFVDGTRASDLVDGAASGSMISVFGIHPNRDIEVRPPPVALAELSGRGETYEYRVNATYHYALKSHHMYPFWRPTMMQKLPVICAGLRSGLAELTSRNARAWQLGPLADSLSPYFMNGTQLWRGTDYRSGGPSQDTGPGRIKFTPFGQLVEPQDITLGFSELPTQEDAQAINRALGDLLDRIATSLVGG